MAEINVERKKKSGWLWLIALLVLAIVGYALYKYLTVEDSATEYDGTQTSYVTPAAPHYFASI